MSKVKSSAKFIAQTAESVSVNYTRCSEVASEIYKRMQDQKYSSATWSTHPLNPQFTDPGVIDWIFTVDCLNFCFWSDSPASVFTVEYKQQHWTGYWSMVAAINRALDAGIPITCPKFWTSEQFTFELVCNVFRSATDSQIPLLHERYQVLKEAGQALACSRFTSFAEVVDSCGQSALALVEWVTAHIRSFDDQAYFAGQNVYIYKRAQILVADLWACFQGKGPGSFTDIDEITMFADYRVPQILAVLGCISYSPSLTQRIANRQILETGCREEVEIRGCSIQAVESIVEKINEIPNQHVNAIIVDFYLWDTAKQEEQKNLPIMEIHRTRSIFY